MSPDHLLGVTQQSADTQLHRNSAVAVNTSASLSKAIGEGEGVIVELSVKFSFIPIKIINRKDPMCELIKQIGLECPFNAGPVAFQKEVMVPDRFIPAVRCGDTSVLGGIRCNVLTLIKGHVSHSCQRLYKARRASDLLEYRSKIQVNAKDTQSPCTTALGRHID